MTHLVHRSLGGGGRFIKSEGDRQETGREKEQENPGTCTGRACPLNRCGSFVAAARLCGWALEAGGRGRSRCLGDGGVRGGGPRARFSVKSVPFRRGRRSSRSARA